MLSIVKQFIRDINNKNISYVHFKSNEHLLKSANGETDFDILVSRNDCNEFEKILLKLDFKRVNSSVKSSYPGVDNWIGFDNETGELIHFHIHYQLVTGQSSYKHVVLPWTNIALSNYIYDENTNLKIVVPEYELIELYTRIILKQNIYLIVKSYLKGFDIENDNKKEAEWIRQRIDVNKLDNYIMKCYGSKNVSALRNLLLKNHITRVEYKKLRYIVCNLENFNSRYKSNSVYFKSFARLLNNKMKKKFSKLKNNYKIAKKTPNTCGLLISFLGVDGSGKSTIAKDIYDWLDWKFEVSHISLGIGREKNKFLYRLKNKKNKADKDNSKGASNMNKNKIKTIFRQMKYYNFSKSIKRDLLKIHRYCMNGGIVITDRYPQLQFYGISDGNKVEPKYKILSKKEIDNLSVINYIQPDLIFKLFVPVEISIARRPGDNPQILEEKYEILNKIKYDNSKIINIDASVNYNEELLKIKREIWKNL